MSVADYLEERGRKKGERSMLLKLLCRRFGALPEAVVQRVQTADGELLEKLTEHVLTASSLDEVLHAG